MFYFRLNKIKIFSNREFLGKAEVRIFSLMAQGGTSFPSLDKYFETNDASAKQAILAAAVHDSVASMMLPEVQHIRDNQSIFFGDVGVVAFQSKEIPDDINWQLIVAESDKDLRDVATLTQGILNHAGFPGFVQNFASLAAIATPQFFLAVEVSKFVAKTILDIISQNQDDQIGKLVLSLNRQEHYLHGIRNAQDVPDMSNNMLVDYSIFAFEG